LCASAALIFWSAPYVYLATDCSHIHVFIIPAWRVSSWPTVLVAVSRACAVCDGSCSRSICSSGYAHACARAHSTHTGVRTGHVGRVVVAVVRHRRANVHVRVRSDASLLSGRVLAARRRSAHSLARLPRLLWCTARESVSVDDCTFAHTARSQPSQFFIVLFVVFIVQLAAAVLAFTHQDEVVSYIDKSMYDTVYEQYGRTVSYTNMFDKLQKHVGCQHTLTQICINEAENTICLRIEMLCGHPCAWH